MLEELQQFHAHNGFNKYRFNHLKVNKCPVINRERLQNRKPTLRKMLQGQKTNSSVISFSRIEFIIPDAEKN